MYSKKKDSKNDPQSHKPPRAQMIISTESFLENRCIWLRWYLGGTTAKMFILLYLVEKKTTLLSGAMNSLE